MEPTPDLTGTLARYELLTLLRSLRCERFTGRLSLAAGDERVSLFLRDGEPLYARSASLRHSFPAWLVRQRILPREVVKSVFKEATDRKRPFDEVIVEQGHLTSVSLVATRQSLARYVLTFAYSLDPAVWEAWRTDAPPPGLLAMDLDPERAFFRFIAQRDSVESQAALLEGWSTRPIRATPLLADREAAFRAVFGPRDPILDAVAGSTTIAALLAGGADGAQVIPRVFALHRAGLARFEPAEDPGGARQWTEALADLAIAARIAARHGRRGTPDLVEGEEVPTAALPLQRDNTPEPRPLPSATPPATPPATPIADPRQVALAWLAEVETASHYGLLGVPHDASDEEVRQAATLVRRRLERLRDAVGSLGDPDAGSAVRSITVRIDQAERTLTDTRRRKLYNSSRGLLT